MGSQKHPKGLAYISEFITQAEESELWTNINFQPWSTEISRRTQHYGYAYPYHAKNRLVPTAAIPNFMLPVKHRLDSTFGQIFDQVIINEYTPGQGIGTHTDSTKLFGGTIISLSLGSDIIMNWEYQTEHIALKLERRSIVVLQDESRWLWKHSIPSRKSDNGIPRQTRISATFRTATI